jgi:NAD(P)H-flavin reductase
MSARNTENIYLPKLAVLDRVVDDIPEVKTFYWRFEDAAAQAEFKRFRPGQFAQVSLFGVGEFPASLPPSPTEEETFFTIRQVGSCTAALHRLKPRDQFAVRGPYGNGFPMGDYEGMNLTFVAGGIGLIPLRSCVVYALRHRERYGRIRFFTAQKLPAN